jgi:quercetin 2,3-dioxygenase
MVKPCYQELCHAMIAKENREAGVDLLVIAGETSRATRGPISNITSSPLYFDIKLTQDKIFNEPLKGKRNK